MDDFNLFLMIILPAFITFLLRAVPFMLFGRKKQISAEVRYLGDMLPYAVMAALVVYCLKGIIKQDFMHNLAEISAVILVANIHLWKKNTILSIIVGTFYYVIFIHVFI